MGGQLEMMDLVMVLLVTEAASHSLGDYTAIGDDLLLILVLMGLNFLVNFLSYHVPTSSGCWSRRRCRWCVMAPLAPQYASRVPYRGRTDELPAPAGIDQLSAVKAAFVEGEGDVSVIKHKEA